MAVSVETVLLLIASTSNLGTAVYLARKVVTSVEAHNIVIPELVKTVDKIDKNQTVLFESRREHGERLKAVETRCEEREC